MFNVKKTIITTLVGLAIVSVAHTQSAWASFGLQITPPALKPNASITDTFSTTSLTFAAPSNLKFVADTVGSYSWSNNGNSSSGQVKSAVYKTPSGTLDFFYQWDVTSSKPQTAGSGSEAIAPFDAPGNHLYTLAVGLTATKTGGTTPTALDPLCTSCTMDPFSKYFGGSTSTLKLSTGSSGAVLVGQNFTNPMPAGYVSPQFFVATNALFYGAGSFTLNGTGTGTVNVFVPNSPEPSSLILMGSVLGLLGLSYLRNRKNLAGMTV
ncbi:MAG: PEP-CTERM sorting domain-containing protein [Leptospirales bacterium]